MSSSLVKEGFVNIQGFRLFYKTFGEPKKNKGTILCLHGGPGATHDYLLPLADLSELGYYVVFYDQLGCGKSDLPKDITLFTVERSVEEVEEFRKVMKLGKIHLMGSSWGGLLAIAYALKYQRNMKSLISTGGLHNVPLAVAEMQRMKRNLPEKTFETLKKYETKGDYENPHHMKAAMVFYKRHVCRLDPWPPELLNSLEKISKPVYYTMNGPNEFTIIGGIRYWDVTNRLREIKVPTLVTGGKYDEVSPKVARGIHAGIKGSKLVIFPKSSHLAFWEERDRYMSVLSKFLQRVG